MGHLAKNCKKKRKVNPNLRCYHCGEKGHLIKHCPTRKEDKKEGRIRRKKVNAVTENKEETEDDTSSEEEVHFLCWMQSYLELCEKNKNQQSRKSIKRWASVESTFSVNSEEFQGSRSIPKL